MTFFILAAAIMYDSPSQYIFYGLVNTLRYILKNKRRLIQGDHIPTQEQSALPGMPALSHESMGWEEGALGTPHPSLLILASLTEKA